MYSVCVPKTTVTTSTTSTYCFLELFCKSAISQCATFSIVLNYLIHTHLKDTTLKQKDFILTYHNMKSDVSQYGIYVVSLLFTFNSFIIYFKLNRLVLLGSLISSFV